MKRILGSVAVLMLAGMSPDVETVTVHCAELREVVYYEVEVVEIDGVVVDESDVTMPLPIDVMHTEDTALLVTFTGGRLVELVKEEGQ